MNRKIINKDIKVFLKKGYKEVLDKVYSRFPTTECPGCGVCCTDSPVVTYPELMYVIDYLKESSLSEKEKEEIVKKSLREFFYGLIDPTMACPFLNESKRCLIHKVAPIACKRWGLQSKEENEDDWKVDYAINKEVKEYYSKLGIELSDEVINRRIPFCDKVKIIANRNNFSSEDFDKEASKIEPMLLFFSDKTAENFTLSTYITYLVLGEGMFNKRLKLMRQYNSGNKEVINRYINSIEIPNLF